MKLSLPFIPFISLSLFLCSSSFSFDGEEIYRDATRTLKILEKLMYQGQETNNNLKEKLFIYLVKRLEIFILLIKIRCKRREARVC